MSVDVQGNELATSVEEQCTVCMGPPGEDSQRCQRKALPLHRTHLVDGVYWLPTNTDEINAELEKGSTK